MWSRIMICAGMALLLTVCDGEPAFSPPADSYREARVTIGGSAEEQTIASVDSTFFGRRLPLLGRDFLAREHEGESSVAILSRAFWVDHLGGRPEVIGADLEVDGVERTIVGVMPPDIDVPSGVALWVPR